MYDWNAIDAEAEREGVAMKKAQKRYVKLKGSTLSRARKRDVLNELNVVDGKIHEGNTLLTLVKRQIASENR